MSQQPQPQNSNLDAPSISQTTSQKRSAGELAVGGDSIADLIRKAKASRTSVGGHRRVGETEGTPAIDTPMNEDLESELTCPICADIFYRPVAALKCLHVFCGSCVVPWIKKSSRCPSCRTRVTAIQDDHRTNRFLDMYLKLNPDKARSNEEKETLDKIYKSGDVIKVTRGEEEDESDEEEVENDDEDDDEPIRDWRELSRMQPCLCCSPPDPNPYGFACEHPIPPAPASLDGAEYREGVVRHTRCSVCQATIPLKDGMSCESCGLNWCGTLFQCTSPGHLEKLSDIMPVTVGTWAARFQFFYSNRVERNIFETWVQTRALDQNDIVNRFKEWLLETYNPDQPMLGVHVRNLSNDTLLCKECFINMMRTNFMNWWIYEKEAAGVDARTKCWYGTSCRTQAHSNEHATKLNHACHETPLAERHAVNPGRLPVAAGPIVPAIGAAGPAQPYQRQPVVAVPAPPQPGPAADDPSPPHPPPIPAPAAAPPAHSDNNAEQAAAPPAHSDNNAEQAAVPDSPPANANANANATI